VDATDYGVGRGPVDLYHKLRREVIASREQQGSLSEMINDYSTYFVYQTLETLQRLQNPLTTPSALMHN
jgi:hypothetical protein